MDEVTFGLAGLLFIGWSMLLLAYAGFWKRRAGRAYYHAAVQASDDKERKELVMRGVLAGNMEAARLYAVMQPDEFSSRQGIQTERCPLRVPPLLLPEKIRNLLGF